MSLAADFYVRDLRYQPYVTVLTIEQLDEQSQLAFIRLAVASLQTRADIVGWFGKAKSDGRAVIELLSELDYINEFAKHFDTLAAKDDWQIVDRLVSERTSRNQGTHWQRLKIDAPQRMSELGRLALDMSLNDKATTTDQNVMAFSGFSSADLGTGEYRFSSSVLQSYFAVRGWMPLFCSRQVRQTQQ